MWSKIPNLCICHLWNQCQRIICLVAKFGAKIKLSYLQSATPNLSNCKILWKNWARISKNYCYILNQHSRICLIAKVCKKMTERLKLGTKNAVTGYFWARIWKQYCHIWNQHSRICLITKFREIMKMPKLGIENVLFVYFWDGFSKTVVIFEISTF